MGTGAVKSERIQVVNYGYCPICKAPGKSRERGINGNDVCENGHKYPSADSMFRPDTLERLLAYKVPSPEGVANLPCGWCKGEARQKGTNSGLVGCSNPKCPLYYSFMTVEAWNTRAS
jgi:hypothetical protein